MNISIFHYHLNPGGVTRIIESQVAGFVEIFQDARVQVITGYCENINYYKQLGVQVHVNNKLNYLDDKNYSLNELETLLDDIRRWILSLIESDELLHVHNLNLGKNPILTLIFNSFLNEGFNLINHAHDFAEDRTLNIAFLQKIIGGYFKYELSKILYPKNKNYLVGVLNQFDYDRVVKYGIAKERVFLWPNPVSVPLKKIPIKEQARTKLVKTFNIHNNHKIITYPVRVIQRKNIGELILLATIFNETCTFLVTMAPRNPFEIQYYNDWKNFCVENEINLLFEAGEKANFEDIICGSDYCITTSKKEGFGMAYLEPWLLGTPVIGRNISSVTVDIMKEGINFPLLYNEIWVPFYNKNVDFKDLNSDQQQAIILSFIQKKLKKDKIFELNDFLTSFPPKINQTTIINNQNAIKRGFSLHKYAERIFKAYKTLS